MGCSRDLSVSCLAAPTKSLPFALPRPAPPRPPQVGLNDASAGLVALRDIYLDQVAQSSKTVQVRATEHPSQ